MTIRLLQGHVLDRLADLSDESVHCVVTSPPYWGLRDYGVAGQIGLEAHPAEYVETMVSVFREVRRVLRPDGVAFLNLGDCYATGAGAVGSRPGGGRQGDRWVGKPADAALRHAPEYGKSGRAGRGLQDRDSTSQNPGDGHRDAWWTRIPDSDFRRALEQVGEPLRQIQACTADLTARLPIAGLIHQDWKPYLSILDQAQTAVLVVERLLASLASMPRGCDPPPLAGSRPSDMILACLSSLRSFVVGVQRYAHILDEQAEMPDCTAGIVSLFEELAHRIQCTASCCSILSAWIDYSTAPRQQSAGIGPQTQPNRMPQSGLKPKDLVGIPWMVAFALRADGWWLRQDIIWSKPNPMPESVTDRCTKAHEYLFLLSKNERYFYDQKAILEPAAPASVKRLSQPTLDDQRGSDRVPGKTNGPMKAVGRTAGNKSHKYVAAYEESETEEHRTKAGLMRVADKPWLARNRRSVWTVTTQPFSEAHFATFPPALIEPCILAGCPASGTVLDPFGGAGTTGLVAARLGRNAILIELNPKYAEMAERRLRADAPLFAEIVAE